MFSTPVHEGFMPFRGYRTFYRVVGDLDRIQQGKAPLLAVHGRPPSHEALEHLEEVAENGRTIVLYDQLGCGCSDRPSDPAMWTIDLFVDELDAICHHLHLEQVHLLGHSWGGMVALEYALKKPVPLLSLILASTLCDRSMFEADYDRLRKELPDGNYETLVQHEAAGTTDNPAYKQAQRIFDLRHICRVDPWPDCFARATVQMPVGRVNTDGWSVLERLKEIHVPTLVTCGRYDIATPAQAEIIHRGILGSELVIFEESSHYPHVEETGKYMSVLNEFMTRIEL